MELNWEYIYAAAVIFGASVIRGYSGFGFAMISVICLSSVFPPAQVTPVILCLDVVASLWLFYKVLKDVDWKGLKFLISGAVISLPAGSYALVHTPINFMRIFISLAIILLCAGLLYKPRTERTSSPATTFGAGIMSGFLTGVAAIGGPPVILFYYSSNRPVSVSRASMIAFFLIVDSLALISSFWYDLLNQQTLILSAGLLVPLGLGIWVGNFLFGKMLNEQKFKKQVLCLLMILASISLVMAF